MDSSEQGLIDFYSAQAETLLLQFRSINFLLGRTNDWTHPGTLCETLLRDLLRRILPSSVGVDKGYVYGVARQDGKKSHGPEIDILLHDLNKSQPIYRLGDFVIVHPNAVIGMIQIKRTFRHKAIVPERPDKQAKQSDPRAMTLHKGIDQAVHSRRHLVEVKVSNRVEAELRLYGGSDTFVKRYPLHKDMANIFSAVIGFDDKTDKKVSTYKEALLHTFHPRKAAELKDNEIEVSAYVLPNFIGSLNGICLYSPWKNSINREYWAYNSEFGKHRRNYALQLLLMALMRYTTSAHENKFPFASPKKYEPIDHFSVP